MTGWTELQMTEGSIQNSEISQRGASSWLPVVVF
jgi:hypothetical protein